MMYTHKDPQGNAAQCVGGQVLLPLLPLLNPVCCVTGLHVPPQASLWHTSFRTTVGSSFSQPCQGLQVLNAAAVLPQLLIPSCCVTVTCALCHVFLLTGIPLAHIVQNHGWAGFFTALLGACGAALALLTLVANAPSYQQREAAKAKTS
jgi:sugar phosphate permease